EEILAKESAQIACLLVDPLLGIGGILLPEPGFLERLRAVTERLGIVLIFDEVISFRIAWGGAQERFGIRPDLTTLGKIIGGGLPVGAFGGRADVMDAFDASRPDAVSHSGTFTGNAAVTAGGLAALSLLTESEIERINSLGDRLRAELRDTATSAGVPVQAT